MGMSNDTHTGPHSYGVHAYGVHAYGVHTLYFTHPTRDTRTRREAAIAARPRIVGGGLVAERVDVHRQLNEAVGVAPLVVVPRHELDEGAREGDARARVEDGRAAVALEVSGDELLVGVAHNALVLGRLGLGLDEGLDLVVGGLLRELAGQVDDGDVGRGHAERHAGQLAVQRRQHLADGLGGAG